MNSISVFQPEIWVLLSHATGDNNQCMALADALGRPVQIKRLDWHFVDFAEDRARLEELLADTEQSRRQRRAFGLHAPWPRVVICCGRRASRVAFWIKQQSGGYTKVVSIGRALRPLSAYDLLVAPPQYGIPERANVIHLSLPMVRRLDQSAASSQSDDIGMAHIPVPKPWFTILLGGQVKQFEASESVLMEVALKAQIAADRHGGTVIVSTSRRTPASLLAAVESVLHKPHVYRWSEADENNPYETLLRQSAALFVTADSVSMILDACGSSTPTYIIELPERADLRRRWRRRMYRLIRGTSDMLYRWGLGRVGDKLDEAQEWLHAKHILRYPRDLRRFHARIREMGLAQPAAAFDPSVVPVRKPANDLTEISGVRSVARRCLALSQPYATAAE